MDVARQRLASQRLIGPPLESAAAVVQHLAAVQAQDFAGATWALALRMQSATQEQVAAAFDAGEILRTHVLRPTWHFVTPDDVRSMLALTAPRVKAAIAFYDRRLGIDTTLQRRFRSVLDAHLGERMFMTRRELGDALRAGGVDVSGPQLGELLMNAELDGVVCSGPHRAKQLTYALLAERAPDARTIERDEALGALTRRYFSSHGPAQARDFAWWSGLTVADANRGLAIAAESLEPHVIDGVRFWSAGLHDLGPTKPVVHLLPNYDELTVAYRDRRALIEPGGPTDSMRLLGNVVAVNGTIRGDWRRRVERDRIVVELSSPRPSGAGGGRALQDACEKLATFLQMPVALSA